MTTPFLTERFEEALVFASRTHAEQVRKGTQLPYVAHLMSVAAIVLEHGGDEDEAIAALLHDAIEDQGGAAMREEIRTRFGDRVTAIVDGCTDAGTTPKPPWRARKDAYLAHLGEADASMLLVSAADKLHNARAVLADYRVHGEELWSRFTGGRDGTLWYYRSLVEAFRAATRAGTGERWEQLRQLVDEVERTVSELERLARDPGH